MDRRPDASNVITLESNAVALIEMEMKADEISATTDSGLGKTDKNRLSGAWLNGSSSMTLY